MLDTNVPDEFWNNGDVARPENVWSNNDIKVYRIYKPVNGDKIQSIKDIRNILGLSLLDAKNLIDRMMLEAIPIEITIDNSSIGDVIKKDLIRAGFTLSYGNDMPFPNRTKIFVNVDRDNTIRSIKDLRQVVTLSLQEAKDIIVTIRETGKPYPLPFELMEAQKKALREYGFTIIENYNISIDEDLFTL